MATRTRNFHDNTLGVFEAGSHLSRRRSVEETRHKHTGQTIVSLKCRLWHCISCMRDGGMEGRKEGGRASLYH